MSGAMNCVCKSQEFVNAFAICVVRGWQLVVAPDGDLCNIGYLLEDFDRLGSVFIFVVRL